MAQLEKAKVFMSGRSQAVRIPAGFRFSSNEVYIRRDSKSGDLVLSQAPGSWEEIFAALDKVEARTDMTFLYMLDTNMVSYIARGRSSAARTRLAALKDDEVACISAITEAEICYGLAKRPDATALRSVRAFSLAFESCRGAVMRRNPTAN